MGRLKLWDNKRENLENKSKQEVIMEESSKECTGPRGAVLPDMMMMRLHPTFLKKSNILLRKSFHYPPPKNLPWTASRKERIVNLLIGDPDAELREVVVAPSTNHKSNQKAIRPT
ncbi:hypothetical protein TNCV_2510491 [Trichonephila clavipes]|nr:hypothetical protein TNCV_2510491 [Trichonephila clavipes]